MTLGGLGAGLLEAVYAARRWTPAGRLPWYCVDRAGAAQVVGWIGPALQPLLEPPVWIAVRALRDGALPQPALPSGLNADGVLLDGMLPDGVLLDGMDCDARSDSLALWCARHDLRHRLHGWRNERSMQYDAAGRPRVALERALLRPLGARLRSAHLNAWTIESGVLHLWVVRRSRLKPVDPGKLDGLVGGGISELDDARATLTRESWEEAGLRGDQVAAAQPAPALHFCRAVDGEPGGGLHREQMMPFDLQVPRSWAPRAVDGESESIELLPVSQVLGQIAAGTWTVEGGVALLDFLLRRQAMALSGAGLSRATIERLHERLQRLRASEDTPPP